MTKFLMIILSVMSFWVETKNSVRPEGVWPYNMDAVYTCTYQKGTVRKGDQAVLTVSGLDGITVQKISVSVKANKQSGAGVCSVTADNQVLADVPVSFRGLNGESAYTSLELYSGYCTGVNELTITMEGIENSLYIERYDISWENASPRSVMLMNCSALHTVLSETEAGAGVVLPALPDTAEWKFVGWSETDIRSVTRVPALLSAYSRYYPHEDTYLWATYRQQPSRETVYMTEPESGIYLYVNRSSQIALSGVPENGVMYPATLNMSNKNQYYEITFASPETAYITHVATGTPIGYEGTKLVVKPSLWQVYHHGEETLFYMTQNKQTYVLWLNMMTGWDDAIYTGLLKTTLGTSPLALQVAADQSTEQIFSCHPDNPQGIRPIPSETHTYSIPFGIYELHITNGQKQLIVK